MEKVWMKPPKGEGSEPQQVEATSEILTPLMVKGWSQCEPPESPLPKKHPEEVNDHAS
jgi:hypothetical protein